MRVVCCGEALFDLIVEKDEKTKIMKLNARPGGSATNTAMIIAKLGLDVSMITRLGTDFMSASLIDILEKQRIETSNIIRDKNILAPLAIAHIDKKGNSSYSFYEHDAPLRAVNTGSFPPLFRKTTVFHTGSFFSYSDKFFPLVEKLLKLAKKENVFVSYDPNWRPAKIKDKTGARRRIKKLLPFVDLLKLSDTDATSMTGSKTLNAALKKIGKDLKGAVVVTLGAKGSFYWNGKKKMFQPAIKVRVADTIGAGDSFTSGLIYRYCRTGGDVFWKEMKKNLEFASAVSALVCTGHGATEGLKNIRQVKSFLRSLT